MIGEYLGLQENHFIESVNERHQKRYNHNEWLMLKAGHFGFHYLASFNK